MSDSNGTNIHKQLNIVLGAIFLIALGLGIGYLITNSSSKKGGGQDASEGGKGNPSAQSASEQTAPLPPPEVEVPKGPPATKTQRIAFRKGSTSGSASGRLMEGESRRFTLECLAGQTLYGQVTSPSSCVTFDSGSSNLSFITASGTNRLVVRNRCGYEAGFSLEVSVY